MIDAADAAAVELAEKRASGPLDDKMLATLIAREAYMLGYEAGRESRKRP